MNAIFKQQLYFRCGRKNVYSTFRRWSFDFVQKALLHHSENDNLLFLRKPHLHRLSGHPVRKNYRVFLDIMHYGLYRSISMSSIIATFVNVICLTSPIGGIHSLDVFFPPWTNWSVLTFFMHIRVALKGPTHSFVELWWVLHSEPTPVMDLRKFDVPWPRKAN